MRIIFITREGHKSAGARVRCYNFARELAAYGAQTEVLSLADNFGAKEGKEESAMGLADKVRVNYKAFKRLLKDRDSIFYIQRLNYHSLAPYLAHLHKRNRIILDLDDWEMRDDPKYYLGFYPSSKAHLLTRIMAKKSIFCVAASRFLEGFLSQFNRDVYYIPSGVDTELFKPSLNKSGDKGIIFSWIGTFNRKEYLENIKLALESFNLIKDEYPHIRIDIVGDGFYGDILKGIIDGFGDPRIRLKGWITPGQVPEYLRKVHVGLLPVASDTKFNRAKSPTKLFEYMAMAKPAVSSDIGESKHIINDGEDGFLAKTREEFTEKMRALVEDAGLRERMGAKARILAEESYSLRAAGRRLYEILRNYGA